MKRRFLHTVEAVSRAVREGREEAGLTQAMLAEKAGVVRRFIVDLEEGHPIAELDKVLSVLAALDIHAMALPGPSVTKTFLDIDLDEVLRAHLRPYPTDDATVPPRREVAKIDVMHKPNSPRVPSYQNPDRIGAWNVWVQDRYICVSKAQRWGDQRKPIVNAACYQLNPPRLSSFNSPVTKTVQEHAEVLVRRMARIQQARQPIPDYLARAKGKLAFGERPTDHDLNRIHAEIGKHSPVVQKEMREVLDDFEERSAARDFTNRGKATRQVNDSKWFHTSRVLFKPGDVLVPGGSESLMSDIFADGSCADYVWVSRTEKDALQWKHILETDTKVPHPYLYEVRPEKDPEPFEYDEDENDPDDAGWVCASATIVRRIR